VTTIQETQTWKGKKVVDADGDKIGTIEEIFLDRHTGEPAWATVKTGLFGLKSSFVPLAGAQLTDDDELRIPIDKELVKDAPKVEADGELTPEEERRLWQHYGRSDYDEWEGDDKTTALAELEDEPPGEPAIVGVRLRRVVIVTVPASDDR
jgi:sporulation protein YlmC with PRC-barrel domain